jgi:predicted dehydrogenase
VTLTALKKGIPVIGEKPMAESMASARKMVAASDKYGKLYMVSQSRRYDKNHSACRSAIEAHTIGTITTINCDFYIGAHFGGFRDEMPSPLILDMAIHHFDMCRFITGADPVSVYAKEFNPKGSWYKGDVSASCIFEMSNGIIFTYRGSWCGEGMHTSWNGDWRIIGDRGTIIMEKDKQPQAQCVKDMSQVGAFSRDMETIDIPAATINGDAIAGSLNEMLDYLENGRKPQGECHDNIKSLAMVFAAIESSKKGRPVPVKW